MTDGARQLRISRRDLISSGAAASLLAASGLAARAEPRSGGTLRIAVPPAVSATRPWAGDDIGARLVAPGSVFDCLTEVRPDGQLEGELAVAWEPRAAGRIWTVDLRRGVAFHHGREFTADDVTATFRPHMRSGAILGDVVGLRRLGTHQVQISLDAPDADLPFRLSHSALAILPADGAAVGTGLYRFAGGESGTRVLDRVPGHYKEGRAGWFARLEIVHLPDAADRTLALVSGRSDAAGEVDPLSVSGPQRRRRIAVASGPSGRHLQIRVGGANRDVLAQALKVGLGREALVAEALSGFGRVAADHPLEPERPPLHDPEQARSSLRRAGIDAASVRLGEGLRGTAILPRLVGALSRASAHIGLQLVPAKGEPDLTLVMAPAQPSGTMSLEAFPREGVSDRDGYRARLSDLRAGSAPEARRELAEALAREGTTVVPFFADSVFAHSTLLTGGPRIGTDDMLDSARIAERWHFV